MRLLIHDTLLYIHRVYAPVKAMKGCFFKQLEPETDPIMVMFHARFRKIMPGGFSAYDTPTYFYFIRYLEALLEGVLNLSHSLVSAQ